MNSQVNRRCLKRPRWSIALLAAVLAGVSFGLSPQAFGAGNPGPCVTNPNNRALDFWLGEWTVAAPDSSSSASSQVTLALDKCTVVERWDDHRGHSGENMFAYSADDKSWHGMFADNEGRVHVFLDGRVASDRAEFTGPSRGLNRETVVNRVTIRRVSDDHAEQAWQKSSDGGKTWTAVFRGEYTRKEP